MPKILHNALTPLHIKNAKAGRHADGGGLQLLVKPSGARSWVFRFTMAGKSRDIGLGAAGQGGMSLADARKAAAALKVKVQAGIDPLHERISAQEEAIAQAKAEQAARISFKDAAESYISLNENNWRNAKHRQQWRTTLASYAYPVIGDLPIASIETAHVLRILEPIWQTKAETANRVRGRLETIFDSAKARGYREGENPARWRGHLALILPVRAKLSRGHHKALPYAQIPAFMEALRAREAVAALALEFAILTAARTGEVLGAKWQELDLEAGLWIVPAERMKTAKEHRVPLSPRALEILNTVKLLGSDWLFPNAKGRPLSSMAMAMLLRRMKVTNATVHGFRSTFRDWAGERTAYANEVAEMALSHTVGDKVERAYRRGDLLEKRQRIMADWADYLDTLRDGGEVVPIRRITHS